MKKIVEFEFDIDKIWSMSETEFIQWIKSLSSLEASKYATFRNLLETEEYNINWDYGYGRIVPKRPLDIEDFENLRGSIIRKKEDKTRHYLILSICDDDGIFLYSYNERRLIIENRLLVCKNFELIAKAQYLDKALGLEKSI